MVTGTTWPAKSQTLPICLLQKKFTDPTEKAQLEIGLSSACPCSERENEAGLESSGSACPAAPVELKMRAAQKELTRAPSSPQQEAAGQSQRRTGSH